MANLGQKNGVFHVRFRFQGKEYKKSLKTRNREDAEAAVHGVEQTIHLITIGKQTIPSLVDPGDFILSGGCVSELQRHRRNTPTVEQVVEEYLQNQTHKIAETYRSSQRTHLGHLKRFIGSKAQRGIEKISRQDLDRFLQHRLEMRDASTVCRERNTLLRFFRWVISQEYISESPAVQLDPIPCGTDLPPFRTVEEIEKILKRGGMNPQEQKDVWECLYLSPPEIAELLELVRQNAQKRISYFLHAIPTYTGMRRGEVLRLTWVDLDLEERTVTARSRKQSRRQKETRRRIDLHEELWQELQKWKEEQATGQFVVCDPQTLKPLTVDQANRAFWQALRRTAWCLNSKKKALTRIQVDLDFVLVQQ